MKKKKEKEEKVLEKGLSEIFLTDFIGSLIDSISPSESEESKTSPIEKISAPLEEQISKTTQEYQQSLGQEAEPLKLISIKEEKPEINPQVFSLQQKESMAPSLMKPKENTPLLPPREQTIAPIKLQQFRPLVTEPIEKSPFQRLESFFNNPLISSIECAGPGKNIIINKSGLIEAIPMTLTQEEIDDIMDEFSKKTKIPLIKGVFKAALGNLLISAVISDFVGTRFHVEKIRPMQPLPLPMQRIPRPMARPMPPMLKPRFY